MEPLVEDDGEELFERLGVNEPTGHRPGRDLLGSAPDDDDLAAYEPSDPGVSGPARNASQPAQAF